MTTKANSFPALIMTETLQILPLIWKTYTCKIFTLKNTLTKWINSQLGLSWLQIIKNHNKEIKIIKPIFIHNTITTDFQNRNICNPHTLLKKIKHVTIFFLLSRNILNSASLHQLTVFKNCPKLLPFQLVLNKLQTNSY